MSKSQGFPTLTSKSDLEDGLQFAPAFKSDGLLPVVTVDAESNAVLMVAYMNAEALRATLETGDAHYWSRSRQELWRKGATSGHTQKVVSLRTDCDQDTLLMTVEQQGPACHVGYKSCFYREVRADGETLKVIGEKGVRT